MDRIVDISTDDLHLSAYRGLMILSQNKEEIGRVAMDDIAGVIVHAHGVTWTTSLAVELAKRGAILVLCANNHAPIAYLTAIDGHHAQNARLRAQWDAPRPLFKRAWQHIVIAKIAMQASLLDSLGHEAAGALTFMADRVKSGDPDNIEAQAARRYWPALFGQDFRRDRNADGANALLNYGYTVMRAMVARSVVASGLHPSIGLHHANRLNAFALADDLVEPFRPVVDAVVHHMVQQGDVDLDRDAKRRLTGVITVDLELTGSVSPVSVCAQRLSQSLATSFETRTLALALFQPPSPLSWRAIANHVPDGETT